MVLIGRLQRALDELATEVSHSTVQAHPLSIDLADRNAGEAIENQLAELDVYCDVLVAGFGVFGRR